MILLHSNISQIRAHVIFEYCLVPPKQMPTTDLDASGYLFLTIYDTKYFHNYTNCTANIAGLQWDKSKGTICDGSHIVVPVHLAPVIDQKVSS